MTTRVCCRCKVEKPLDSFYRDARKKDGHEYRCKACARIKDAARFKKIAVRNKALLDAGISYVTVTEKKCCKCKTIKPATDFGLDIYSNDGLQSKCALCTRVIGAEYKLTHREECLRRNKVRYAENRDSELQRNKDYKAKNRDKVRVTYTQWQKVNADKVRWHSNTRRVLKISRIPSWYSELDELVMDEAFKLATMRESSIGGKWHVDHCVPLKCKTASGLHIGSNIQVIPQSLNNAKRNRLMLCDPGEWLSVACTKPDFKSTLKTTACFSGNRR